MQSYGTYIKVVGVVLAGFVFVHYQGIPWGSSFDRIGGLFVFTVTIWPLY